MPKPNKIKLELEAFLFLNHLSGNPGSFFCIAGRIPEFPAGPLLPVSEETLGAVIRQLPALLVRWRQKSEISLQEEEEDDLLLSVKVRRTPKFGA